VLVAASVVVSALLVPLLTAFVAARVRQDGEPSGPLLDPAVRPATPRP
jgi:2-keto-3-deoxygluconate permease